LPIPGTETVFLRTTVLLLAAFAFALDAETIQERAARIRQRLVRRSAEFAIRDARPDRTIVERFTPLSVRFRLDGTWTNPFDPDDIRVDGIVTLPDGSRVEVPAFYCEPWEPVNGLTQLTGGVRYRRTGQPHWRLRFSPFRTGRHTVRLRARDRLGRTCFSPDIRFDVQASKRRGFIRVSPKNPMYFEDSADGSLFLGVGTNVAWTRAEDPGSPAPCYEYYFGKARGRMNATRVWLCHWAWLEWMPLKDAPGSSWEGYGGLGVYNQMIAAALDRVFALADEAGLRVMLVTDDNDEHMRGRGGDRWTFNPYNRINGGPCETPGEVFSSAAARRAYRKRLRYILARWGAETALWALNAWNDYSRPTPAQLDWLREMHRTVHDLCRGWRPIIYGANFRYAANDIMDYAQAGVVLRTDKPNVVQECYYTDDPAWFIPVLRRQLWSGIARGLAAVMVWPHPLVDRTGAWDVFRPANRLCAGLDMNRAAWKPLRITVLDADADMRGRQAWRVLEASPYGDVPEWGVKAPTQHFSVDVNRGNQWLKGFCRTLYGASPARAKWRNPPLFELNMPAPGKLIIELSEIGSGDQILGITVNGALVKRIPLRGGRRYLRENERRVETSLPAGRCRVMLDNVAPRGDWIRLRRLLFAWPARRATDLVDGTGRIGPSRGLAWLENTSAGPTARRFLGDRPVLLRNVTVQFAHVPAGCWRIAGVSTVHGREIWSRNGTARDGRISVTVPTLPDDLVLQFARLPRSSGAGRPSSTPDRK